jgi:hypothetical protein
MPNNYQEPIPAGWALNAELHEGKGIIPNLNKTDIFRMEGEYQAANSSWGRQSEFGSSRRSMVDEEELRWFKEEKEQRKLKVGDDRKKYIDDVYASQINIGTSNSKLPSYLDGNSEIPTLPMNKFRVMRNSMENVIDLDNLQKERV